MKQRGNTQLKRNILTKILERFNKQGLKYLCFELGIDYDDLSGSGRSEKSLELVLRCEREGRLHELDSLCNKKLPVYTRQTTGNFLVLKVVLGLVLLVMLVAISFGVLKWMVSQNVNGDVVGATLALPTVTEEVFVAMIETKVSTDIPTNTPEPLPTATQVPTNTATDVPTSTITHTATPTLTLTPTDTTTPEPTITPAPTSTPIPSIGSTRIRPADEAVMVFVPEGEFAMGSNNGDSDQQPIHDVYLDSYYIDQMEITNRMYGRCTRAGVCEWPSSLHSNTHDWYWVEPEYNNHPVIYVSWQDANTYCEWAGGRLPTEAEWEKAARWDEEKQEARTYSWGEGIDCKFANALRCVDDTTQVGIYSVDVSPYGAYDMTGNVREWVYDKYNADYYENSVYKNPTGPLTGDYLILRGGSWQTSKVSGVNLADRSWSLDFRHKDIGFRCVQEFH